LPATPNAKPHDPDKNFHGENVLLGIRVNKALLEELAGDGTHRPR
jgi:hypothetical protein